MIDTAIFGRLMGAFADRIHKPLGDDALALYYATLSAELTTEQFQAAMTAIFRDHVFATWPAPAEIIDRGRPSRRLDRVAEWTQLETALRRDEYSRTLPQLRKTVSEAALSTFLAIGGVRRWMDGNDWRREAMRTEFLECYEDMRRLPSQEQERLTGPTRPALKVANGRPEPIRTLLRGVAPYSPGDPEHG